MRHQSDIKYSFVLYGHALLTGNTIVYGQTWRRGNELATIRNKN